MKTKNWLDPLLSQILTVSSVKKETALHQEIQRLVLLLKKLEGAETNQEKIEILDSLEEVCDYFSSPSPLRTFLAGLSSECELAIKSVIAIKQGAHVFAAQEEIRDPAASFHQLLEDLLIVEHFYKDIGGIIGYQCLSLSFLVNNDDEHIASSTFLPPDGIDISIENHATRHAAIEGIRHQKEMVEIYPVGGAADRLQLKDENTGMGLPAACLIFLGKHLLEGVVCDLQAREYLYFKLFHEQILTPIALMTSKVNQNHDHIQEIFMKNRWFGRPRESFNFFSQPSIPVFTREGKWCLKKPLKLLLRPGGHGVIWKLAEDKGIFDWFKKFGRKKALIRQINNPMAAVDYGLCSFLGIGHEQNKSFGFASCERRVNAHEGMNVLKIIDGKRKALTNIEYCDFKKFGIEDKPRKSGENYSRFPSNTNILFANLDAVREAIRRMPFPGLLVNFRVDTYHDPDEGIKKEEIARLETTMQNIADAFEVSIEEKNLPAFVTFNERRKTISTTKKKTASNGLLLETPEGCFYDFMQNAQELLGKYCGFELSLVNSETTFLREGPPFLVSYHPALGPFYSIIRQKIYSGKIHYGSELQLEIADLDMKSLFLDGSLLILADHVLGHHDEKGHLVYSNLTGQCILRNVRVENEGIDWLSEDHLFWKHEIKRRESLTIRLRGHSRFEANDIVFKGKQVIEVPDGVHLIAKEKGGEIVFERQPLKKEAGLWSYSIQPDESISLSKPHG